MSEAHYESLELTVADPVATITFNRPDRLNALTGPMLLELQSALGRAEADPAVVGIVLTGAGRGFCAGADMSMLQSVSEGQGRAPREFKSIPEKPGDRSMGADYEEGYAYLLSIRKPIVAAINGPCAGLGFALALLCDLRFASERATFTTAFANRGLIAEHGMSWILPRLVGPAHALDLLWSGRKFDALEAERMGVVNRIVSHDTLVEETQSYITYLATHSAPASLQIIKRQVYQHLMLGLGDSLRESNQLMEESLTRAEFREGVASYVEKRPPQFPRIGAD